MTSSFFKDNGSEIAEHIRILADAGYQGMAQFMKIARHPSRNPNTIL